MEQLVFELADPEPPRLANFLVGRNGELVAILPRVVAAVTSEPGLLVWGPPGAGKTHLLHASMALARERGTPCRMFVDPEAVGADDAAAAELVVIDRIDEASPAAAGRIFTLFNALKQRGGRLIAASRAPLALLPLREDLRTRLGWGLVYEVLPLADDEKPAALTAYARQRGFALSAEVIDYLLRHGRRDMQSLLGALTALDRVSLATKRPITVPLLKEWLQGELEWMKAESGPAPRD